MGAKISKISCQAVALDKRDSSPERDELTLPQTWWLLHPGATCSSSRGRGAFSSWKMSEHPRHRKPPQSPTASREWHTLESHSSKDLQERRDWKVRFWPRFDGYGGSKSRSLETEGHQQRSACKGVMWLVLCLGKEPTGKHMRMMSHGCHPSHRMPYAPHSPHTHTQSPSPPWSCALTQKVLLG